MLHGDQLHAAVTGNHELRALRVEVRDLAQQSGVSADDVVLATSELVTNALMYVGGTCHISGSVRGGTVRIEVFDHNAAPLPAARQVAPSSRAGRGLSIVDRLTSRSGVQIHDGIGKTVWFEIDPAAT